MISINAEGQWSVRGRIQKYEQLEVGSNECKMTLVLVANI